MTHIRSIAACGALALAPWIHTPALAQATPDSGLVFNAGGTTNYVLRGFTQSWSSPALHGGVDYTHPTGLYLGTWLSTLSEKEFAHGPLEADIYGGYSGAAAGLNYSTGLVYYAYPGSASPMVGGKSYDYAELKLSAGHAVYSATYYYTITRRYFGTFTDGQGSGYLDLAANPELGHGYTLQLHGGIGRVRRHGAANWEDAKVGLARTFEGGWTLSGAVTRAWDHQRFWTGVDYRAADPGTADTRWLGKTAWAFTLVKTF